MPEWEIVETGTGGGTERLAVPGGWLYRSAWQDAKRYIAGASGLAFVPGVVVEDGAAPGSLEATRSLADLDKWTEPRLPSEPVEAS